MNTPNYEIDPNNPQLAEVKAAEKSALTENTNLYTGMANSADAYYSMQADAVSNYGEEQKKLQQEKTDFAIDKINQQKDQAKADYLKEQSGAYVDWQKQSNQYGANAEQMAAQGMTNTGYSESSQVSMYNTYQNRVSTARESYNRAVINYDNAIKDAQLQNNALLAEIAYNTLQKQIELSIQGFQYKNTLLIDQANRELDIKKTYQGFYTDVLDQLYKENALKEDARQFDVTQEFKATQADLDRQHDFDLLEAKAELEAKDEPKDEDEMDDYGFLTPPGLTPVDGASAGNTPTAEGDGTAEEYFDELAKRVPLSELVKMLAAARENGEITGSEYKKLLKKYSFNTAGWLNSITGK